MWKIFSSLLKKSENASPFSLSVRKCTSKEKNFFYVEHVNRDRCRRYFKEVKGNCAIHSVPSGTTSCRIQTGQVSWYCENCIEEELSTRPVRTLIMFLLGRWCNWNQKSNNKPEWLDQKQLEILALLRTSWQKKLLWPLPPEIPGRIIIF